MTTGKTAVASSSRTGSSATAATSTLGATATACGDKLVIDVVPQPFPSGEVAVQAGGRDDLLLQIGFRMTGKGATA